MEIFEDIPQLSVEEAHQTFTEGATFIDVRNQDERELNAIPGTIHIPLPILDEQSVMSLNIPKEATVLIHCARGGRSHTAAKMLKSWGYQQVMSMKASLQDWKDAGYELQE